MIDGLKISVSSTELKTHIEGRAKYHAQRAEFYSDQAGNLKSGGLQLEAASNDPVGSLERSAKDHGEKAAFFSFLAEHIIPDERYILSENDLARIEIFSRYF